MRGPNDLCDDASFRNEEVWESDHVLDSTRHTPRVLDANNQKDNLSKIVSNSTHLNDNEQNMVCDVLKKYELLFDGTLGTWKTDP